MANYIPRTGGQKKKNILHQKELVLRADIRRAVSKEKLDKSAEHVRSAQLGVIKALICEAEPSSSKEEDRANERILELEKAQERWHSISVHEIIEFYSGETGEPIFVERKKWWDLRPR